MLGPNKRLWGHMPEKAIITWLAISAANTVLQRVGITRSVATPSPCAAQLRRRKGVVRKIRGPIGSVAGSFVARETGDATGGRIGAAVEMLVGTGINGAAGGGGAGTSATTGRGPAGAAIGGSTVCEAMPSNAFGLR